MTDGLKGKQLWVIAGFTGSGKSALAGNIASNIAVHAIEQQKRPVAFFSIEMPREDVIERVCFASAEINLNRVRDGLLSEKDFPRIQAAASQVIASKLIIDDTPGLTVAQFRSRARKAVVRHKAALLIVDYVQIMAASPRKGGMENRALEVKEIMQGLRETAKQLNVPILALAQLNRQMLERPGGRPSLADLKESAAIAEEANLVGLLWQPSYMVKDEKRRENLADKYGVEEEDLDQMMELDIAKQRKGPRGSVVLRFKSEFTKFEGTTQKLLSNNARERQRRLDDDE
jgi:replicative DNA helicase